MNPHPRAADLGRTLASTFHEMKKAELPFKTYQIGGYLQVKIPGFFCPKCKKFTPGQNLDVCGFEGEHR